MSDLRSNSEIFDGVHWIGGGFVNGYVIEQNDHLILIDTLFNKAAKQVMKYIKTELSDKPVTEVFLTHHHTDHVNGLHKIYERYDPKMYTSHEDSKYINGSERRPPPNIKALSWLFRIIDPFITGKPVQKLDLVKDKDVIHDIEVNSLPGHTLGSLGFRKSQALFLGDAAAVNKKGELTLPTKLFTESLELCKQSLTKLKNTEFSMVLPGHGPPILEDAKMRLSDLLEKIYKEI